MIGTIVGTDEVKARWGYCDLFSARFAQENGPIAEIIVALVATALDPIRND
jgi:hypothetical protein